MPWLISPITIDTMYAYRAEQTPFVGTELMVNLVHWTAVEYCDIVS